MLTEILCMCVEHQLITEPNFIETNALMNCAGAPLHYIRVHSARNYGFKSKFEVQTCVVGNRDEGAASCRIAATQES